MDIKTNEISAFRYGAQIIGTRPEQEDCFATCSLGGKGSLLVLADGMGGHSDGEKASACVVGDIIRTFRAAQAPFHLSLPEVAEHANSMLGAEKQRKHIAADAGCTLIIVRIGNGRFDYLSIGDSYLFYQAPAKGLRTCNKLHTVAAEMEEQGATKEEIEANPKRKALTCAVVGRQLTRAPYTGSIPLAPGGRILVSSDGLLSLAHAKVDAYLRSATPNPQGDIAAIVTTLLEAVVNLNRERQDNTTVVGYQEPPEGTSADTPAAQAPPVLRPAAKKEKKGTTSMFPMALGAAALLALGSLATLAFQQLHQPAKPAEEQSHAAPQRPNRADIPSSPVTLLLAWLNQHGNDIANADKTVLRGQDCPKLDDIKKCCLIKDDTPLKDIISGYSARKKDMDGHIDSMPGNDKEKGLLKDKLGKELLASTIKAVEDQRTTITNYDALQEFWVAISGISDKTAKHSFEQAFNLELDAYDLLQVTINSDGNLINAAEIALKEANAAQSPENLKTIIQARICDLAVGAVNNLWENANGAKDFRTVVDTLGRGNEICNAINSKCQNIIADFRAADSVSFDEQKDAKGIIGSVQKNYSKENIAPILVPIVADKAFSAVWAKLANQNDMPARPERCNPVCTSLFDKLEMAKTVRNEIEKASPKEVEAIEDINIPDNIDDSIRTLLVDDKAKAKEALDNIKYNDWKNALKEPEKNKPSAFFTKDVWDQLLQQRIADVITGHLQSKEKEITGEPENKDDVIAAFFEEVKKLKSLATAKDDTREKGIWNKLHENVRVACDIASKLDTLKKADIDAPEAKWKKENKKILALLNEAAAKEEALKDAASNSKEPLINALLTYALKRVEQIIGIQLEIDDNNNNNNAARIWHSLNKGSDGDAVLVPIVWDNNEGTIRFNLLDWNCFLEADDSMVKDNLLKNLRKLLEGKKDELHKSTKVKVSPNSMEKTETDVTDEAKINKIKTALFDFVQSNGDIAAITAAIDEALNPQ